MGEAALKVKGVLIDLDGTLVDSREAYFEAARAAFAAVGESFQDAEIALEIPKRLEQYLPLDDLVPGDMQKFLEVYLRTYYRVTPVKTKPMPNVSRALEMLSGKAKLALITMRYVPKNAVIEELKNFGLAKYFQHVTTALDTQNPKPSPEPLIASAQHIRVLPCECAVVGDSIVDIRSGKAAGARTVAVLSGIFSLEELEREKPNLILENLAQLPSFIGVL